MATKSPPTTNICDLNGDTTTTTGGRATAEAIERGLMLATGETGTLRVNREVAGGLQISTESHRSKT